MDTKIALMDSMRALAEEYQCVFKQEETYQVVEVSAEQLLDVMRELCDREALHFEQLMDVAGVDYLEYGQTEWKTAEASSSGFSRGVEKASFGRFTFDDVPTDESQEPRFAVAYQLLSISNNQRLSVKVLCEDNDFPRVPSVTSLWASANWFEREAFDMYGIIFEGHPDLRRLLTDYGFIGHPLRKDFPLVGNVEMRFDPEQKRVIYEPVSIEPRVLVPKVIRNDSRYIEDEH